MYLPTALDGTVSVAGFNAIPNRRLVEADFRAAIVPDSEIARLQAALEKSQALARRLALTSVDQRKQIALLKKQLEDKNQQLQRVQTRAEGAALDPNGYYQALGIYPESLAGLNEDQILRTIKISYKAAAAINHPDQGGDTRTSQFINEAYDFLSDAEKIKRYGKR